MPASLARNVVLLQLVILFWVPTYVQAHIAIYHPSMFCANGPKNTVDYSTNTVVNPLYGLQFSDYWFGNGLFNGVSNQCYNYPPPAGEFLELPAGGSFDVQFVTNRAYSSMGPNGGVVGVFPDGGTHADYDQPGYYVPNCIPQPNLHTHAFADVAGSAFAISYNSDYASVQPDNMVVFSVAYGTPWHTAGSFQVPANMPACPPGGCLCAWGWVPNNCGTPNIYLQLFRCKVTGALPKAPALAPPQPPVFCENNQTACVQGAKQMVIWHQAERNNVILSDTGAAGLQNDGGQKSPGYNLKMGFADGPQNDIFLSAPASMSTSTSSLSSAVYQSSVSSSSTATISSSTSQSSASTGIATKTTTSSIRTISVKSSSAKASSSPKPTSTSTTSRKQSSSKSVATSSKPSSTSVASPSAVALPAGWSLIVPCMTDVESPKNRAMAYMVTQSKMTPYTCVSVCDNLSIKYAGVENGNQCFCSNTPNLTNGAGANATGCTTPCSGDRKQNCGGRLRMTAFANSKV